MEYVGKGHWDHVNRTGMFLDQKIPTEKFKYDLDQIDWVDDARKERLFDLASSNVKLYGNLNPYAFVLGSLATVVENNEYVITKDSLKKTLKLLDNTNYEGTELSELIEKSDIIRYARLYIRLEKKFGQQEFIFDDGSMGAEYYGQEEEEEYDENYY